MSALLSILRYQDEEPNLDLACLQIAEIEFPGLPAQPWLDTLDFHAEQIHRLGLPSFRLAAHRYLFAEAGFRGNEEDYYNPLNSCLNHVLESHGGIPITLSVIYMEIARRLGVKVDGIGAPGHFLVRLDEDGDEYYIDPFRRGQIRDDVVGEVDVRYLTPTPKRTILIRMLNNLRLIYLQRQSWRKASRVLDLLLEADPVDADALRQRAASYAATLRYRSAAQDLERYLELRPFDPDIEELKGQVTRLHRMHAHKN
jgi:regulator of sirC expression with transglutaminase-like and TPR domain